MAKKVQNPMDKHIHQFRIASDPNCPEIHHVFMDGKELNGVKRAEILYEPNCLPSVRLTMCTLRVDVDEPCVVVPCVEQSEEKED